LAECPGWSRIIYRYIDLRKEDNAPLYHPATPTAGKNNLFAMIFRLLQENRVRAYEYLDGREEFTEEYQVRFPICSIGLASIIQQRMVRSR